MPYPDYQQQVERLVSQHRQLEHQPLLLALYYAQDSDPQGVYLLEVISQFGYNEVSEDQDMFEIEYNSSPGFLLPAGSRLHILLTNPVELQAAVDQKWSALSPVQQAIRQGRCRVIHEEPAGSEALALLREERVAA